MTEVAVQVLTPTPIEVEVELPSGGSISVSLPAPIETVTAIATGPKGDKGDKGDMGDTGPEGGKYYFEQLTPSDEWVVVHNLGRHPIGIQVRDSTGQVVGTEIQHDSVNQFRSLSDGAFSGELGYS